MELVNYISDNYQITTNKGLTSLYKDGKYVVTIKINGNKVYIVHNNREFKIPDNIYLFEKTVRLVEKDYIYKYNRAMLYAPFMNKSVCYDRHFIHSYLSSLGFKLSWSYSGYEVYKFKMSTFGIAYTQMSLTVSYSKNEISFAINANDKTLIYHTFDVERNVDYMSVESLNNQYNVIKRAIDSHLKVITAVNGINNLSMANNLTAGDVNLFLQKLKGFSFEEESLKENVKKQLTEILEKL